MGRLTKEQIEFIKNNADKISNREMAEKFGCDKSTISSWRRKLKVSFSDIHDFSKYNEYICKNYYLKTSTKLAEEIGCSKSYIGQVWRENNLKGKTTRRYYSNFSYFKNINSPNVAYILGLIASDGCIYTRKNHEGLWQISLSVGDAELLEQVKKEIKSENPIIKNKKTATLSIVSNEMFNDLISFGLVPRKTYEMDLQILIDAIPKKYYKDFIHGYFDGDGSITVKDKPSDSYIQFALPERFAEPFQNMLKEIGIKSIWTKDNRYEKYTIPFGNLEISGTTNKYCLLKLFQFENGISMKRKAKLSHKLCEQIQSNITNRSENKIAVIKWGEMLESLRR